MRYRHSDDAPAAIGPYSQAVEIDGWLYTSGQIALDPATEEYTVTVAASIARLYGRPRVWNEAFHSSGWGRTTDQTLSWLSTGMAFGANLYDEHGLYYDTRALTVVLPDLEPGDIVVGSIM